MFHPDFDSECQICQVTPCVVVEGHIQPDTDLCGIHFFNDPEMIDWELWNEYEDQDQSKET